MARLCRSCRWKITSCKIYRQLQPSSLPWTKKKLNVAVIPAAAAIAENTPPAIETAVASTDVETVQKVTDPIVIEDVTAKTSS
mmetsp:Transcript_14739/g.28535  ORF Transcript_14739/g.28535 Transcript_14739/m.28535 type:complete len:83 (+) Transcript_14739:591-839(+)